MNAPARQVLLVLMLVLGVVGCNGDVVFMGADAVVTPPPSDAMAEAAPGDGPKEGPPASDAMDAAALPEVAAEVAPEVGEPDAAPADDGGGQ
jgi:hypothetical protein